MRVITGLCRPNVVAFDYNDPGLGTTQYDFEGRPVRIYFLAVHLCDDGTASGVPDYSSIQIHAPGDAQYLFRVVTYIKNSVATDKWKDSYRTWSGILDIPAGSFVDIVGLSAFDNQFWAYCFFDFIDVVQPALETVDYGSMAGISPCDLIAGVFK